jgi:pyridoxine 4-dehydrogenase
MQMRSISSGEKSRPGNAGGDVDKISLSDRRVLDGAHSSHRHIAQPTQARQTRPLSFAGAYVVAQHFYRFINPRRSMTDNPVQPPGGSHPLAGRLVSRIGYGAMQLEKPASSGSPDQREMALEVLRRAVTLGINHIDTANFYGDRVVNTLIHAALWPYPDDLVIVTKLGAAHAKDSQPALVAAQRPEDLRAGVEADLQSLGVEQLDIVNLRRLDRPPGITASGDQIVALDDQLAELTALCDEGKIGAIGLSNVSAEQLQQALPAGIACVQNLYSLVDRNDETVLQLCREHDIAWVPYFPLGGAFPGRPKVVEQPAVIAAAAQLEVTAAHVGLAWLLAHAPNILLIPGTSNVDHLVANVASGSIELSPETIAELDNLEPVAGGAQSWPART